MPPAHLRTLRGGPVMQIASTLVRWPRWLWREVASDFIGMLRSGHIIALHIAMSTIAARSGGRWRRRFAVDGPKAAPWAS